MTNKVKFRVGQLVWCKLCRKPAKIVERNEFGNFLTDCYETEGIVLKTDVRPLTLREINQRRKGRKNDQ